jgi:hypothetical protein
MYGLICFADNLVTDILLTQAVTSMSRRKSKVQNEPLVDSSQSTEIDSRLGAVQPAPTPLAYFLSLFKRLGKFLKGRIRQSRLRNALQKLRLATDTNDDQIILDNYDHILDSYDGLEPRDRERVKLAMERLPAWQTLQMALQSNDDDDAIVRAYVPILENYNRLTKSDTDRIALARKRIQALGIIRSVLNQHDSDDEKIYDAYDHVLDGYKKLQMDEVSRITRALRIVPLFRNFKIALGTDEDDKIIPTWVRELRDYSKITAEQRKRVVQAIALKHFRRYLDANEDDDVSVIAAYDRVLDDCPKIKPEERERLTLALNRNEAFDRFRAAWDAVYNDHKLGWEEILNAYDPILDGYKRLNDVEKTELANLQKLRLVRDSVIKALNAGEQDIDGISNSDWELVRNNHLVSPSQLERLTVVKSYQLWRSALGVGNDHIIVERYTDAVKKHGIPPADKGRNDLAMLRVQKYDVFEQAYNKNTEAGVAAYDPVLDEDKRRDLRDMLTPQQRAACKLVMNEMGNLTSLQEAIHAQDWERNYEQIVLRYQSLSYGASGLNNTENHRLQLARHRLKVRTRFRQALTSGNPQAIVNSYDAQLEAIWQMCDREPDKSVAQRERNQYIQAREKLALNFIQTDNLYAVTRPSMPNHPTPNEH